MVKRISGLLVLLMTSIFMWARTPVAAPWIDDDGFDTLMSGAGPGKIVFLDFSADWCAPCHRYAPTFDAMAEQYADKGLFFRVDVDKCPRLVARYYVSSVPMTVAVHSLDTSLRTVGDITMSALQAFILRNLTIYNGKTDN